MKTVLKAKFECNQKFKDILISSGNNYIAEATNDKYWGCRLSSVSNPMYTLPDYHPGKHRLGHLMMELRISLCQDTKTTENHVPETNEHCIVQMPSSLIAMTQYSPNSTSMTSHVLSATNSPSKTKPNSVDLKSDSSTANNSKVTNSDKNKEGTNVSQPGLSNEKRQETADRSRSKIKICSIDRFVIKMNHRSLSKKKRLTEENDH